MFKFPDPEHLLREVQQEVGLNNFGDDSFRESLAMLLHSVEREAQLSETSAAQFITQIKRRLRNRLEIEEWYRRHPEIDQLEVQRPLSISGLPRTGTTALANILSLDDQFRPLRSWEQSQPCPPPILEEEAHDPRRLAAEAFIAKLLREQPEFAAMHLSDVDATEEDVEVLGMAFRAQQLTLPIFDYHAWWRDTDMRPAFAYHRRVIKLLQSQRPPGSWLFKAPAHNFHLEAVFSAYPDLRMVITHRDPAKAIPSAISLLCALQPKTLQPEAQKFSPEEFGLIHSEHLRLGVERSIAARARIGESRFLDVHHKEFVADPFGTLARIYRFLDRELRPEVLSRMREWHAKNRNGAHGSHRYTPEQFGLSAAQIRSDFDFYMKRFDVTPET